MIHKYDNPFSEENKYGHTVRLLEQVRPDAAGVHLDLAAGFGHLAEPLVERFGRTYVGVDLADEGLASLRERGFETHSCDLLAPDAAQQIAGLLAGRQLASISMLDGLEHFTEPERVLDLIAALAREHSAPCVLSVPNVAHTDITGKLLLGQWQYTEAGLLDVTHFRLWNATSLREALDAARLRVVAEFDVEREVSDQAFPPAHAALLPDTSLAQWVSSVRGQVDSFGKTNQFIWVVEAAAEPAPAPAPVETPEAWEARPFLSVLVRATTGRVDTLREALLSLASQTLDDFDVAVLIEDDGDEARVREVIGDQTPEFAARIRLVVRGDRTASAQLNDAARTAHGKYVSVVAADDFVFAHWVESFHRAAYHRFGQVVRGMALNQETVRVAARGRDGLRGTSAPEALYEASFSLAEHLISAQSPLASLMFPATLWRDLGLEFEDDLDPAHDLGFVLRAAELCGVIDVRDVVAVVRRWQDDGQRPATDTPAAQRQRMLDELDSRPFLLGAGSVGSLVELHRSVGVLRADIDEAVARLQFLEPRAEFLDRAVELKDNHIANLEAMVEGLQAENRAVTDKAASLAEKLATAKSDVRKARRKVRKLRARVDGQGPTTQPSLVARAKGRVKRVVKRG